MAEKDKEWKGDLECNSCGEAVFECDGCGKKFRRGNRILHLDTCSESLHYHSRTCYIKNVIKDWDYDEVI